MFNATTFLCTFCPDKKIFDSAKQQCIDCPAATPFFNNEKCVTCSSDTYYNKTTKSCISCPTTKIYNDKLDKCECPVDNFWDDFTCIPCYLPKYFSFTKK